MPDSNSDKPRLPDDDESIDLGHLEPVEEGASALSFSGASGSRSGGSSSGIRSWEQLVRESGGEPPSEQIDYDQPGPAGEGDEASDKNLLREVLAAEPPPSDIVLKDPSQSEFILPPPPPARPQVRPDSESVLDEFEDVPTAQPASGHRTGSGYPGPKSGPFELPPELSAPLGGDSSIISHDLSKAPGDSGLTSDLWGSSSDIDLMRPIKSVDVSSGSLQPTDEVEGPALLRSSSEDSSHALLGDGSFGGDESSAVDLGAQPAVDLPFSIDSAVGSSLISKKSKPATSPSEDSGTVDLLTPSREFEVDLPETDTSPSWAAAREDLPPTVPMVPAGKARMLAWGGGGAIGLVTGIAACAGVYFLGLLPGKTTNASPPTGPSSVELAAVEAKARDAEALAVKAQKERDAEAAKVAAANAEVKTSAAEVQKLNGQLTQAQKDAAGAKAARDQAKALADKARLAESKQAELTASIQKLTTEKAAAESKAREAVAKAERQRDETEKAHQEAQMTRAALESANAGSKQAASFAAGVAQRLGAAPSAASADLLAALDRALTRPTGEPVAMAPTRPLVPATPVQTPQQMDHAAQAGFSAFRTGDPARAEREFSRLAISQDGSAIHYYFLGLAQYHQGHRDAAAQSFQRGWELERESKPPPSEVEAAFERLSRDDHVLVNYYRR